MSLNGDRPSAVLMFARVVDEMREIVEELEVDLDSLEEPVQQFVLGLRAAIDQYYETGEA